MADTPPMPSLHPVSWTTARSSTCPSVQGVAEADRADVVYIKPHVGVDDEALRGGGGGGAHGGGEGEEDCLEDCERPTGHMLSR